ncbi:ribosome-binding protein 1 isoform X1 [Gallus gallus]|uniref:Ribosome binding protein 1 n=1 Tax=Gallus gallus TaxID=9031 RepID=A0A8V0Z8S8_CHICK|nr:ribosome-binding protein 1 [Gallus gallus]XP_015138938.2 ribosome-binding protein 1 isoform X1 [Gallus gallus]XP_040552837.1 ribosome-binding protein 1 isoform X1 [Gallus gallus]XP_040552838.1 ribosome-binding protein 1 isoform X1 [Gallus gallus]XP_040552839.1 ribosome-binding protein 1 isoform X1 [Gallus gallus]XP_040552841.1 ribosome-binding protein 1 isoform X1 [Gallus gallus]XP_040552842.1 ribosome-binding protein 1 isoform X1 [Gallus gallus]XP_040552843.1 ribosome-binding protein 1 i
MDVYDPQTLGVVVFGGFMVISAIGIFLVSTFSMKETSYEEALAKQRKELEKTNQHKIEKKKKEKPVEKKGKAKKKEEKPNGKIPEQQVTQEVTDSSKDVVVEPAVVPEPIAVESPIAAVSVPPQEKEKPALSPKEKRKKEKKVAKVEPAPSPALASPPASVPKGSPVLEVTPKEVPVVAVPPVGTQQSAPVVSSVPIKKPEALPTHEEQKHDGPVKKKSASKKKAEPAPADSDGPLYLPYKTLVSTISSMAFSEGEAQQLIEILTERAGIVQDTWHTATQKGDPVAVLKRQLEEKEKQLTAEQEDAAAARNKLRELSKELAAEKAKAAASESKLKEQLVTREREITAVQARMQASYQDHVNETQQLQGKIRALQEQLENGPNTQLARLQQENSILRDALNQATSQTESKQNAELAKLRQECNKLMKELSEKSEVLQQEEQQKKSWEIKAAASEKQIEQLQTSQREMEATLQKRLDEVSDELRKTQTSYRSLVADAEKAKGQQQSIAELQAKLLSSETEVKSKLLELDSLKGKLQEASSENTRLLERIKSIEALLEAGRMREAEEDRDLQAANEAEMKQLQLRLQEKTDQLLSLEREAAELREAMEQQKTKNNDLREKNWKAVEALTTVEKACEEKLLAATKAKEELAHQLDVLQTRTKETLLSALPEVTVSQQDYEAWLQEFKEKAVNVLKQHTVMTEPVDSALKLKEAEEAQSTLQAECEQYRAILAETEGMLRDLQKSVEEEEQVWKAKLTVSEEELQKSQLQLKSLEDMIEKLKAELQSTDQLKEYISLLEAQLENHLQTASSERQNYTKEVEGLRQLLSESQEQLEAAKTETQKQSKELALVRQQLSEMKSHVQDGEVAGSQADLGDPTPFELKMQLEQNEALMEKEQELRQKLTRELEEAQSSACSLQAELEKLRLAENAAASDMEEAQHLKERLEKEKKLTRDLGQAATKLQELLKVTQDQLAKERETVKKLKEQLHEKGEEDSSKEGTSV